MHSKNISDALKSLIDSKRLDEARLFLTEYYSSLNQSNYFFNCQLKIQNIEEIKEEDEYSKISTELNIRNDKVIRKIYAAIVTFLVSAVLVTFITTMAMRSQLLVIFLVLIIFLIYLIKGLLDKKTKLIINPQYIEIINNTRISIASKDILLIFLKTRKEHLDSELIIYKKNTEVPLIWKIQDLELTGLEIGYQINRIVFEK